MGVKKVNFKCVSDVREKKKFEGWIDEKNWLSVVWLGQAKSS